MRETRRAWIGRIDERTNWRGEGAIFSKQVRERDAAEPGGGVGEKFPITNSRTAVLVKKDTLGRYALTAGDETFEVYVLGEMLK